jgi:hypothetical protein
MTNGKNKCEESGFGKHHQWGIYRYKLVIKTQGVVFARTCNLTNL